jgi:hypothetical protein
MGVDLGPTEQILPTDPKDNARGYWEQQEICEINEEILRAFGGTWARPPDLPQGWQRSPPLAEVRYRAHGTLTTLFGTREQRWAWKDPRASVTLPFWRDLVGKMDYVLCVRNPADVATSLVRRGTDGLDFDDAVTLWIRYIRAALEITRDSRRLILCYENYFTDAQRQIKLLTEFVYGGDAQLSGEILGRVKSFIEPELWHNRDFTKRTVDARVVSPEAFDLYAYLAADASIGWQNASARRHQSFLTR